MLTVGHHTLVQDEESIADCPQWYSDSLRPPPRLHGPLVALFDTVYEPDWISRVMGLFPFPTAFKRAELETTAPLAAGYFRILDLCPSESPGDARADVLAFVEQENQRLRREKWAHNCEEWLKEHDRSPREHRVVRVVDFPAFDNGEVNLEFAATVVDQKLRVISRPVFYHK